MLPSTEPNAMRFVVLSVVKHAYLPNAFRAHPRCVPVAVADDPDVPAWAHERNAKLAAEYGVPYVRDVSRALREFDAQIAVVSSEAERHCELSVRAANAGLHVVQDKPMSTELSECDRVIEAVARNRVKFLLWNRNYLPALLHAKQLIAEEQLIGDPRVIHVDFYFSKDAGPRKGTRRPEDPPINWLERQIEAHADGSDGGVGREPMGELQIEGIYPLAYIRLLMPGRVEQVFARTTAHFHQANFDNDVDDLATVSLQLEGGRLGSLCIGRIGAASHPDIGEIKLHILGTRGSLVVSEARPEVAVYYRQQPEKEFKHVRVDNRNEFMLVEDFLHAIDTDGETCLDARAGRDICATVEAALRSARSGRVVAVAPP